jgi:hypothetical protein
MRCCLLVTVSPPLQQKQIEMCCRLPSARRRSRQPAAVDRDAPPPPGGSWTGVATFCCLEERESDLWTGDADGSNSGNTQAYPRRQWQATRASAISSCPSEMSWKLCLGRWVQSRRHLWESRLVLAATRVQPRHRLDAKNFAKIFRFSVTSNL